MGLFKRRGASQQAFVDNNISLSSCYNTSMLTRREFIIAALGAAAIGTRALADDRPGRLCRPTISGALWWYDPRQSREWGVSGWRDELDRQSRIGFNLLWLCNSVSSLNSDQDIAAMRDLLDLCATRKMRVMLDTGTSGGQWYTTLDAKKEIEVCGGYISRLAQEFGSHPAFYAWYVPHEIYMCWGDFARYIDELYPALVKACKKAVDAPVTVSPFFILDRDNVFGQFRYNEPDEYEAYWARLIARSGFDVVMMQDSGEHFSYVTNDMRRPFFEAMYNACRKSGAEFWGNVECAEFECPSLEEYAKRYGRVHHSTVKNAPWRPVPVERLVQKLELASEYCTDIVTWGYREFCRPDTGDIARKWYDGYRAYYRGVR